MTYTTTLLKNPFTKDTIKCQISDSAAIFARGEDIYRLGSYILKECNPSAGHYHYVVDGNYGDYDVKVKLEKSSIKYSCNCPYHSDGCKHAVAVCLDILSRQSGQKALKEQVRFNASVTAKDDCISHEEMRIDALERREKSAMSEKFRLIEGETLKGEHYIINAEERGFVVTLHDPRKGRGHCTCPDFRSNRLGTCKHIIHTCIQLKKKKGFADLCNLEKFPFTHIYWDSVSGKPRLFHEQKLSSDCRKLLASHFNDNGDFIPDDLASLCEVIQRARESKDINIDEYLVKKVNDRLFDSEVESLSREACAMVPPVNATLYPYQRDGIRFGLLKRSIILGDEMGLGKTLQAIGLAMLKRELFDFRKVLIITPASLKEQWRREIIRFTDEKPLIVKGGKAERQRMYDQHLAFFTITNYEAVLRDILAIKRFSPDLVILDEAQRIKNFETMTSDAIKSIPHRQSIVISGTPLENRLEDLYSIVQFADFELLTPLWEFAANHFIMKKDRKNKIEGYRNLDSLHKKLQGLVIRRTREEVLTDLPDQVTNEYFIDLTKEQMEIHQGYARLLCQTLSKKFLTPLDIRRIQELLTSMRMICDSTYLIDKKTNLSPKLDELETILNDIVLENGRKVVIFSEWTTMTYLIGKVLSDLAIPFVEFTGKVPVNRRQALINEFTTNPDCKVFLSTDAGGVGLNLQAADCVINFDLPWNPAKLNQRIGRVLRIGQKSRCVNVVNLIAKNSIEEKILAGINLKQELFSGVFDGTTDEVLFNAERKTEFLNRIRDIVSEEPLQLVKDPSQKPELSDSTPHFLNPKILQGASLDMTGEELPDDVRDSSYECADQGTEADKSPAESMAAPDSHAVKMERDADSAEQEAGEIPLHSAFEETVDEGKSESGRDMTDVKGEERDVQQAHSSFEELYREAGDARESESSRSGEQAEDIEEVLESGMQFLSGLMSMATGKPLVVDRDQKMLSFNRDTGEVTLKFKLPGFHDARKEKQPV